MIFVDDDDDVKGSFSAFLEVLGVNSWRNMCAEKLSTRKPCILRGEKKGEEKGAGSSEFDDFLFCQVDVCVPCFLVMRNHGKCLVRSLLCLRFDYKGQNNS